VHTHRASEVINFGTYQVMVPSVLRDLVDSGSGVFVGDSRRSRLNDAYIKYRKWCKLNRVKSVVRTKFNKSWIHKKYPQISQQQAKAASLRSMTYWLKLVCLQSTSTDHDKVRSLMVSSFVDADVVCRRAGRFFTQAQHNKLCCHLERALVSYNYLASESLQLNSSNFKLLPKFHAGSHAYDSRVNPRSSHCYADEDMVGRLGTWMQLSITSHRRRILKKTRAHKASVYIRRRLTKEN
jgi:hypothetical protein